MRNSASPRLSLGYAAPVWALVFALFVWRETLGLSLFAWDTFPLIAAGRFESFDGLLTTLSNELMAGRFPGGHYWRPLVHLSFGLDHALWGLSPFGYHLTDFLLLVASTTCVMWLARALSGSAALRWSLLAGLVFALHPVQFEIVPLPPRRADALCLFFTLFALLCAVRKLGSTSWLAAASALCAVASKETGALVALLLFALGCVAARGANVRERCALGLKTSWPALASIGLFLAGRARILDGLGGGARASIEGVADVGRVAERYGELVLTPLPPAWVPEGVVPLIFAAVLMVFLFVAAARVADVREPDSQVALSPRAVAVLLAIWMVALMFVTALAGTYRAWYALPFVAPLALVTALAASTVGLPRAAGRVRVFGAILASLVLQGWVTDTSSRWDELRRTSSAAQAFLEHFDDVVSSLQLGSTAELSAYPEETAATRHGRDISKTMLFREYSLEAYAELAHPGRIIRVAVRRDGVAQEARPDELLVLLVPRGGGDSRDEGHER